MMLRSGILLGGLLLAPVVFAADQTAFPTPPAAGIDKQFEQRTSVAGEDGTIPPVVDRNPDPQAGPRIWVNQFNLKSIPEFPDDDITREKIGRLTEQLRYDAMKLRDHIAHGYSRQDLVDIAQILSDIEARGIFAEVTPLDIETLMDIVSEQRLQRGLTHGQLEEIAQVVTRYYRERGYILARGYIPAQEVSGGIVELRVLEGRLGGVQVQGKHRVADDLLVRPFEPLLGGPVTADNIQGAMYLANDLPGIDVFGYFSAGDKIGDTRLNLNVRTEQRWNALLRLDNHGSEFTGEYRAFGLAQWFNPTGIGDEFHLGVLQSGEPANSTYGLLEYLTPVFGLRNRLGLNLSYNDYAVGGVAGADDLVGTTTALDVTFRHNFVRGRRGNFYMGTIFSDKKSELTGVGGGVNKDEESHNAGITTEWDQLFERQRMLVRLSAQIEGGEVVGFIEDGQSDTFAKLYLEGSTLFFVPALFSDKSHRVVVNSVAQWSDVKMPSVELYSLGGPNAVRAFGPSTFSADRAGFVGAEWYLEIPKALDLELAAGRSLKDVVQVTLFVDYGYGTQVALEPDTGVQPVDQWAALTGAGVGVRFNWGNRLSGQLSVAEPLGSEYSDPDVSLNAAEDATQFWFDLTYQFR